MMDKVLASLAYPLGFALIVLLGAAIAVLCGLRRTGGIAILLVAIGLWMASTPLAARLATASLEDQYPPRSMESYKPVDVIILLGGALSPPGRGDSYPDLGEASDRVVHAFRLYKAGLAPKILISGGNLFSDGRPSEADAIEELLEYWGVGRDAILTEGTSRNTFENAREVSRIWRENGFRTGLLVTSAIHMPRALAVFGKAGLTVESASTDARAGHMVKPFPLSILPSAESLEQVTQAIKEWIGLAVYRWRGWA